jgi:hypothetical protein
MRNSFKFIALAVLALAAPASHAATITYNAAIGCGDTCVTVSVEWQNIFPGVSYLEVDDNFGDFLFGLNTDPFPESTGQIDPNPQTISGLSLDVASLIDGGGAGLGGLESNSLILVGTQGDDTPTFANLVFEDSNHNVIDEVRFSGTEVPEPAAWSLAGVGFLLLFVVGRIRRRKLHTGMGAPPVE